MVRTDPGPEAVHLLVLAAVCGAVFFFNLSRVPFYNKGEPREALVVRDIVLHGNWFFPLRGGEQIPSKPPLFHWAGAAASIARGHMTEATIRFPSALFATFGVFLLYFLGKGLYEPETAFFAGLILATTMVYQSEGVEARVDMTLTFFVILTLVIFYGLYQRTLKGEVWTYIFFVTAGIGVLAKGPVSLVLSGLIIGLFLALKKRWDLFRRLCFHRGLVLGIAVFSLWYGAALWWGGEKFFGIQFAKENFDRFFVHGAGGTGHQKPVYYFVPYLFSLGLPWTLFLPVVIADFFRDKYFAEERSLYLGLWAALVFVFFSLSAGKRSVYILPLYPALALLTAVWLRRCGEKKGGGRLSLKIVGGCAFALGLVLLAPPSGIAAGRGLFWFVPYFQPWLKPNDLEQLKAVQNSVAEAGWLFPMAMLISAALWFLTARNLFLGRIRPVVAQLASLSVVAAMTAEGIVLPAFARDQSYKAFVETARREYSREGPLNVFGKGLDYSSILFYGGAEVRVLNQDGAMLRELGTSGDYFIMGERQWREFRSASSLPLQVVLQSRGAGPDRDNRLVLIRGIKGGKEKTP